jgi:phage tail-like protein
MTSYTPPVGFHFKVDFSGLSGDSIDTRFQEVSGLSMELGVEEYAEGGENRFVHRLPARAKFGNLTLKRGLFTGSALIKWCKAAIEEFVFVPLLVNVTLLNENSIPLDGTYTFVNAWPVKWSVSDFKAQDNALVIETLELSYNYFTKTQL